MASAWVSADFTGTKRMVGRQAASLIASASLRLFLPRLTKGLTYCGGISRTVCPSSCATRPQWWELPHASSTTSVGEILPRNVSNRARVRSWRRIGRSRSSTPYGVKTDLDVSTAIRLNSISDGSSVGRCDSFNLGTNQGAAGVDGQTISDFEADLGNNLYKLWNRLSSGSYFPPP